MEERDRLEDMKRVFLGCLDKTIGRVWKLNGCANVATKTLNIMVEGVDAQSLILMADNAGVCISAGSACNSRENMPSHVLTALGLTPDQARSSFRVSFSRMNTLEDAECAAKILGDCIGTLLAM